MKNYNNNFPSEALNKKENNLELEQLIKCSVCSLEFNEKDLTSYLQNVNYGKSKESDYQHIYFCSDCLIKDNEESQARWEKEAKDKEGICILCKENEITDFVNEFCQECHDYNVKYAGAYCGECGYFVEEVNSDNLCDYCYLKFDGELPIEEVEWFKRNQ